MEQEAVIYYYMVQENSIQFRSAKTHWWQRCELQVLSVGEEYHRLCACPVPCYFYKKKPWQPARLDEAMEQAFSQVEGMADTVISAEVRELLGEDMSRKWEPRPDTLKMLTALRLERDVRRPAKAVIYLGAAQDEDWQMKMAWELLQPYLPTLNYCVVRCPFSLADADSGEDNAYSETDFCGEGISAFTEECYYKYGLVVQTENYGEIHKPLRPIGGQADTYCLKLDFREDNLYHSAVKYLDTIVKNSYYE
jgi:hypothetical protein